MVTNVRSQVAMVFHLDKCIGCHTCSVACKNIWTDRKGTEYMWWNNVETKPGTGFPTLWEDQTKYKGGWEKTESGELRIKSSGKVKGLANLFHQPSLPTMDDYYEPFNFKYEDLTNAPAGKDQPTARPISAVTGEPMEIEAGPNWDDDLSGSPIYAENDPNLMAVTPEERAALFEIQRMVFFYVPRMCNHCTNPTCVAACPSGAMYKRGEDGVVLINQEVCRGWRHCVAACPYKKTYYNWQTGKSEKCLLCFPRLETGQAPACFHSCVGRIRYLGVLLYDADRIEEVAKSDVGDLVEKQREMILNPHDPEVIAAAKASGIADDVILSAQKSPVYKFVKEWRLAMPLHPEFRTLPMLFYVPPLLPVVGKVENGTYEPANPESLFGSLKEARVPVSYLASLFSAGNPAPVIESLKKLMAVRHHRRGVSVGDLRPDQINGVLKEAGVSAEMCEAIYKLTALASFEERFVIPAAHREKAHEMMQETELVKKETGFGIRQKPARGE